MLTMSLEDADSCRSLSLAKISCSRHLLDQVIESNGLEWHRYNEAIYAGAAVSLFSTKCYAPVQEANAEAAEQAFFIFRQVVRQYLNLLHGYECQVIILCSIAVTPLLKASWKLPCYGALLPCTPSFIT